MLAYAQRPDLSHLTGGSVAPWRGLAPSKIQRDRRPAFVDLSCLRGECAKSTQDFLIYKYVESLLTLAYTPKRELNI